MDDQISQIGNVSMAQTDIQSPDIFDLDEFLMMIKQRIKPASAIMVTLIFLSLVTALLWPPTYRSSATILIEQQEIPKDLVRSTVTSYADQRIQVIAQRAMTFSNLSETIKKYELYPKLRKKEPLEVVVQQMREDIDHRMISAEVVDPRSGRPVEATIAFSVSYQNDNPALAQKVANELTSLFLSENIKNRTEMAEQAQLFFAEEAARLETEIKLIEEKLSEFKQQNMRFLPEMTTLNLNLLDRTEREYFELSRNINSVEERIVYLKAQLARLEPNASVLDVSANEVLTPEGRAKYLQNQYTVLLASYSARHPDVIRVKRELDELIAEGVRPIDRHFIESQIRITEAELAEKSKQYSSDHPDVVRLFKRLNLLERQQDSFQDKQKDLMSAVNADNLAYLQVKTDLEASQIDLKNLLASKAELKTKREELEQALIGAPSVEREYRAILRDFEVATAKYAELKLKLTETELAKSLELERKAERFTLIESPLFPEKPVKPNRLLVFLFGVILAFIVSASSFVVLQRIDPSVRGRKGVYAAIGAFPLATIPLIQNAEDRDRIRRRIWPLIVLFLVIVVGLISLLHFFYFPIDVLMHALVRKLGF